MTIEKTINTDDGLITVNTDKCGNPYMKYGCKYAAYFTCSICKNESWYDDGYCNNQKIHFVDIPNSKVTHVFAAIMKRTYKMQDRFTDSEILTVLEMQIARLYSANIQPKKIFISEAIWLLLLSNYFQHQFRDEDVLIDCNCDYMFTLLGIPVLVEPRFEDTEFYIGIGEKNDTRNN